jgi:hypothetical protein
MNAPTNCNLKSGFESALLAALVGGGQYSMNAA